MSGGEAAPGSLAVNIAGVARAGCVLDARQAPPNEKGAVCGVSLVRVSSAVAARREASLWPAYNLGGGCGVRGAVLCWAIFDTTSCKRKSAWDWERILLFTGVGVARSNTFFCHFITAPGRAIRVIGGGQGPVKPQVQTKRVSKKITSATKSSEILRHGTILVPSCRVQASAKFTRLHTS